MKTKIPENIPDLNDGVDNSPGSGEMMEGSVSQNEGNSQLNYGDIVIMIWRRVKMHEKMGGI